MESCQEGSRAILGIASLVLALACGAPIIMAIITFSAPQIKNHSMSAP